MTFLKHIIIFTMATYHMKKRRYYFKKYTQHSLKALAYSEKGLSLSKSSEKQ